jgi:PD-(D/E)XK nuclease superfamily domain
MAKGRAKTKRSGNPLEYVIEQLTHYGFAQIKGSQIKRLKVYPPRFIHAHAEYETIFDTRGYHEGVIYADSQNGSDFLTSSPFSNGSIIQIVIECKFQYSAGSVDEKVCYFIDSFRSSPVPNWIFLYDGSYWTGNERGKKVLAYLKRVTANTPDKKAFVLSRNEFRTLVLAAWK